MLIVGTCYIEPSLSSAGTRIILMKTSSIKYFKFKYSFLDFSISSFYFALILGQLYVRGVLNSFVCIDELSQVGEEERNL